MAWYKYRAKKKNAEIIHSTIEASGKDEAVDKISQLGLYPILVEELSEDLSKQASGKRKILNKYSRPSDYSLFFLRQLSNFLRSGVPILKAIDLIGEHVHSPKLKSMMDDIYEKMKQGSSLSESLRN